MRSYLPIAASLFTETTKIGEYLVADISAGGVLLANGPAVEVGIAVRVVFAGDGIDGLAVGGTVRRAEALRERASEVAVEFGRLPASIEDALQDLVLEGLTCAGERAILLVHPKPTILAALAGDVIALGHRPVLATTPLEAIRWLCESEPAVEAVLIDQAWDPAFGREILDLVREEFPAVRALALGDARDRSELAQAVGDAGSVSFLEVPFTPSELRATLEQPSASEQPSAPPMR